MPHPKNRAERRRYKKKYTTNAEREEAIQLRLAEEAREAKEALDELRANHKPATSD